MTLLKLINDNKTIGEILSQLTVPKKVVFVY